MSDETAVARRENNVITKQEENSTTEKLFSEFNKVFVSGKLRQNSNTVMKYCGKNSTEQESE